MPSRMTVAGIALAAVTRVAAAILLGDRFHFIAETIDIDAAAAARETAHG